LIYLDSCALLKVIIEERESKALEEYLDHYEDVPHVSSAIIRVEMRRALLRDQVRETRLSLLGALFRRMRLTRVTDDLLDQAGELPGEYLRSLDAIHLATANLIGDGLTAFLTYDKRLGAAAEELGLPVLAPS
jgi:predicted nucleic acid-binding protein